MKYNDLSFGQAEAVFNKLGGMEGVMNFLSGKTMVVKVPTEATSEPTLDFIIRVDRTVRPTYPDWMKKVMHSDLEPTGPTEYDLQSLGLWLHDDQKNGVVSGNTIYVQLKEDNTLADCLGLADLLAIQAKGITVFRKLFAGKAVFGWKSVVRNRGGDLSVPCLHEVGDWVILRWLWLNRDWNSSNPALRFSK